MEDKEKLAIAQDWVRKLANGINPLNGNAVKEDDIVNNVHISRCLFYVADMLGAYSERRSRSNSTRTIPFNISALQKEKYNYAEAISISAFSRELEKLLPENMKGVSYKSMTTWLMQQGLLVESEPDIKGRTYKMATAKGNEIGISTEQREREDGGYLATLYNRDAQKYLLDHIEEISLVQE